jgi:hypothetical protein
MEDLLPGVPVTIPDNTIPALGYVLFGSDPGKMEYHFTREGNILFRKIIKSGYMLFGYRENMNIRLRVDVVEDKDVFIRVNGLRRDVPGNDPAENTILIVHDRLIISSVVKNSSGGSPDTPVRNGYMNGGNMSYGKFFRDHLPFSCFGINANAV